MSTCSLTIINGKLPSASRINVIYIIKTCKKKETEKHSCCHPRKRVLAPPTPMRKKTERFQLRPALWIQYFILHQNNLFVDGMAYRINSPGWKLNVHCAGHPSDNMHELHGWSLISIPDRRKPNQCTKVSLRSEPTSGLDSIYSICCPCTFSLLTCS